MIVQLLKTERFFSVVCFVDPMTAHQFDLLEGLTKLNIMLYSWLITAKDTMQEQQENICIG